MDVGKALGFVFEDEDWVTKILLGTVILLIPIFGGLALMGYTIAVMRSVMADEPRPLPEWKGLGDYFIDGLKFWVATLVYALPIFVIMCPFAVVWLLPALAGGEEDLAAILAGISGVLSVGLGCLAALYGILMGLLMPVVQIRYAETGEIGDCLRFGEMFRFLFGNLGSIIVSQLLVWFAGMVLMSVVGGLSLGLLVLPIGVWLNVFSGHLYGQIGRQAGVGTAAV
jgi:hypothetical protein